MIDRWISRYTPAQVIAALEPQLTAERRAKIEAVLAQRLAGLTVVIENLHDPHNGAAALRSVEGFGLSELHVVEQSEPFRFSPKVSQGCEKWVAIHRYPDFAACAAALHARGFQLLAAVPPGDADDTATAPTSLADIDITRPTGLVFGNEHAGLTGTAQAASDGVFNIPMPGFTRSFNLSVSVAMSVYDCSRRRRAARGGEGDLTDDERTRLRARWYALSMDERAAEGIVERISEAR